MTKASLEVTNEKLEAELEETKHRLRAALSRPITEGADGKTSKASVVTRSAIVFLSPPLFTGVFHWVFRTNLRFQNLKDVGVPWI